MRESRVDFPALGSPTSPIRAMSLSSSRRQRSLPVPPGSARSGAWFTGEVKAEFPRPPRPPAAARNLSPGATRSASVSPVASSRTTVPGGTAIRRSGAFFPCMFFPMPCWPRFALKRLRYRKSRRVERCGLTSRMTLPPFPPFPPSGPPRGTNFSRRKLTQPRPPSPERTVIVASSMKCMNGETSGGGEDGNPLAVFPHAVVLHHPVDQREEGVVLSHPDVGAGVDRGPPLADEDGAGGDGLAAEPLHAEPLAVAVPAVSGAAYAFLVRHAVSPCPRVSRPGSRLRRRS